MDYEKEILCAFSSREITPCVVYKISTKKTFYTKVQYHYRKMRKRIQRIFSK